MQTVYRRQNVSASRSKIKGLALFQKNYPSIHKTLESSRQCQVIRICAFEVALFLGIIFFSVD